MIEAVAYVTMLMFADNKDAATVMSKSCGGGGSSLESGCDGKTEHSHPLGMVVSTHFRCGKGVKRGLKNGALPFNID